MPFSFEAALGNHEKILYASTRRTEILAANMANGDTPGYKARDLDFKAAFGKVNKGAVPLKTTSKLHIQATGTNLPGGELLYRISNKPPQDGNTVDMQVEEAKYAQNAIHYQATIRFLGGRFKGMINALRNE